MDSISTIIGAIATGISGVVGALVLWRKVGATERIKTNHFAHLLARWRDWAQVAQHWDTSVPPALREDTTKALDGEDDHE